MTHHDIAVVVLLYAFGHLLGAIDGAVLSAGAAERYHEAGKVTLLVFFDGLKHYVLRVVQEGFDLLQVFEKVNDRKVASGVGPILRIAARIG